MTVVKFCHSLCLLFVFLSLTVNSFHLKKTSMTVNRHSFPVMTGKASSLSRMATSFDDSEAEYEGPSDSSPSDGASNFGGFSTDEAGSDNSNNYSINQPKDMLMGGDLSTLFLRSDVIEAVLKLEKTNPTENPSYSPLLNGVWTFASFAGFGSPGLLGYQALKTLPSAVVDLSDLTLTITSVAPRASGTGSVKVGPVDLPFTLVSDIQATSGTRLKEQYNSANIGPIELPLSSVSILSREVVISYLDEDLLIVRDQFGSPEILRRKDYISKSSNPSSESEAS